MSGWMCGKSTDCHRCPPATSSPTGCGDTRCIHCVWPAVHRLAYHLIPSVSPSFIFLSIRVEVVSHPCVVCLQITDRPVAPQEVHQQGQAEQFWSNEWSSSQRGDHLLGRGLTNAMLCAYLSHSRACVGVDTAYHMTTTHAIRPLLTLACISVYIACASPRIGRQPAIPASGAEGLGSYLHRSDPGDHGRHV